MLDVVRNTSRNMPRLGIVSGEGEGPPDVGCCTQHGSQHLLYCKSLFRMLQTLISML
jgi:hypothetical protein